MSASLSSDPTVHAATQHQLQDDLESTQQRNRPTPLPKLQLLSVCISRIAEPFAYTQIFPYVNEMVWRLGVTNDPKKVGFYSGMIDSMFAFAQLFTVYGYGRLSDRIGRKPVVLFSVFGVALSSGLFGFSGSFAHMMASRTIAGLLSGYVAVLHSILGEITDDTNQSAAYPIYALCYPIGSLLGPLVGGALADPNQTFPNLVPAFLHDMFAKYPYMLSSMAACTVAAMSFAFVLFFMEETLPSIVRRKARKSSGTSTPTSLYGARGRTMERAGSVQGSESSPSASSPTERSRYSSISTHVGTDDLPRKSASETDLLLGADEDEEDADTKNWTVSELLKLPELRQLYRSSVILSFLAEAYVVVFVLFSYTEIQYGGLGFDPSEIGLVLAVAGSISFALQILLLPSVLRRGKPTKMFGDFMALWPIGYAIPPILNIIARASSGNGQYPIGTAASAAIWTGIWIAQLLTKTACTSYAMNMIIARQSAPDKRALGTTNGLNQFFMCAARMFAPVTVSALFALSTEHNWLGGHLIWLVMVVLSILGWKASEWN